MTFFEVRGFIIVFFLLGEWSKVDWQVVSEMSSWDGWKYMVWVNLVNLVSGVMKWVSEWNSEGNKVDEVDEYMGMGKTGPGELIKMDECMS